jgi:predicted dehydrogenase
MGTEVEEAADIVLVFQGNVVAHISASYNYVSAQFVEVYGTRGMLRIDPAWNNEGEAVELRVSEADGRATPYRFQKTNQFEHQIRHLCECLNTGRPNRIPPEDSIRQMRVLDAIFESAKTGQVVAVAGDK